MIRIDRYRLSDGKHIFGKDCTDNWWETERQDAIMTGKKIEHPEENKMVITNWSRGWKTVLVRG